MGHRVAVGEGATEGGRGREGESMHSESVAPSSSMATSQGRIATGPFDTPLVSSSCSRTPPSSTFHMCCISLYPFKTPPPPPPSQGPLLASRALLLEISVLLLTDSVLVSGCWNGLWGIWKAVTLEGKVTRAWQAHLGHQPRRRRGEDTASEKSTWKIVFTVTKTGCEIQTNI